MITWDAPWAFALLLPVLLLPLQGRLTGRKALRVASGTNTGAVSLRVQLAWLPKLLQMLGLSLVVVALARPQITHRTKVKTSEGLDIMLAIDTSGSMQENDLRRDATRLDVAKEVVASFVEERPDDRIGVVVFGAEAFTHVPLTLDHRTLSRVLQYVNIGVAGDRSTAIGTAIAVATRRIEKLDAPEKIIILLTDGENTAGKYTPAQAADAAAALGVKIYTIGIGGDRRGFFGGMMGSDVDEDTLRDIAERTGGRYFRARSASDLSEVYARIDELEPTTAEVEELSHDEELYGSWLMAGLGTLLLEFLLSLTWFRRFP